MTKNAPRFFVADVKKKSGKSTLRVLRQRKVGRVVPRTVVEGFGDTWTVVKTKFVRKSKLFESRNAARRALNDLRAERLLKVA